MTSIAKPGLRPANPNFSSGPCAKRPGWSPAVLANAVVGRSHRAKIGKSRLERAIRLTREVLGLSDGLAAAVDARTAGNPLFAVQLVGDWVQRGVIEVVTMWVHDGRDDLAVDFVEEDEIGVH